VQLTGENCIGLGWSALGHHSYRSFNPRKNCLNESVFYEATEEEIELALQFARKAAENPLILDYARRSLFLRKIAHHLTLNQSHILTEYIKESGLSEERGRAEMLRTTNQFIMFADYLNQGVNPLVVTNLSEKSDLQPFLKKITFPLGPVLVFGASNFPLAYSTAGGDVASAIAAGCPVIVKGHPMHPGTSERVARCIQQAARSTGMPEGVFSFLHITSNLVAEKLILDARIKAIGFTGSFKGGMAIHSLAGKREDPIPVFAEMGSLNPLVVLAHAQQSELYSHWIQQLSHSVCNDAGQFCTKPGVIFLEKCEHTDTFIHDLKTSILNYGEQCMLHPDIRDSFLYRLQLVHSLDGVEVFQSTFDKENACSAPSSVLITGMKKYLAEPSLHEELFGPVTVLVVCDNTHEIVEVLGRLEGQLTASLIASVEEREREKDLLRKLVQRTGRLILNGVPTGVTVSQAMHHGGIFPATTDSRFSAVGLDAIKRFTRPVCLQSHIWEEIANVDF
jgi:alpha-ketoglutaric semialdehyde dehydrogenase